MAKKNEPIDYTKVIKIIDPVVQSILIIVAFYIFDRKGAVYHKVMLFLMKYQLMSAFAHFFLKFSGKLKAERWLALISIIAWVGLYSYFYANMRIKEQYLEVILGKGFTKVGILDTFFMVTGVALAFWYFSISFREVSSLIKRRRRNKYVN
ncbi:MAG: hypothetical protein H7257_10355 [Taibaiella sp.]|nr:hypothetical protein [Taibaiella sp.]